METFNLPGSQMDYQKIHLIVKRSESLPFSESFSIPWSDFRNVDECRLLLMSVY